MRRLCSCNKCGFHGYLESDNGLWLHNGGGTEASLCDYSAYPVSFEVEEMLQNMACASQNKSLLEDVTQGAVLRSIVQLITIKATENEKFSIEDLKQMLQQHPNYEE